MNEQEQTFRNHLKYLSDFRWRANGSKYKLERWISGEKGEVLFNLIQEAGSVAYFESGTANGFSTMFAALALPEDGVIHTFDPANRKKVWDDPYFDGMHYLPKINYKHSKFNRKFEDDNDVEEKQEYWPGVLEFLPFEGRKFFFIDGDHSYNGVTKDFETIKDFLNEGDVVAFDDVSGEKATLKGYLNSIGNMPHYITSFQVDRLWIEETQRVPRTGGDTRKKKTSLGVIKVLKCEDIPVRRKDHFDNETI